MGTHDLKPEEIVDFCNYARREYYLRPAYLWVKLRSILRHPAELRRTFKAFFTFYKYLFGNGSQENKAKFKSKLDQIKLTANSKQISEQEKIKVEVTSN